MLIQDEDTTYMIIRKYQNHPDKVIDTDLTLAEAQAHCRDPETSSRKCTHNDEAGMGNWFDSYDEE
jgi:hypothetical protein